MASIIITPGPDTLLVMRNSANSGRGVGFATVFGVQVGLVFHTLLALVGVTAILAANTALILVIGIGGGLFIAYLAWQTWRAGIVGGAITTGGLTSARRAFADALMTNALNPKVILAFFALMLPLISLDLPRVPQILLMSAAALVMNTLWQGSLVIGARWFSFEQHKGSTLDQSLGGADPLALVYHFRRWIRPYPFHGQQPAFLPQISGSSVN